MGDRDRRRRSRSRSTSRRRRSRSRSGSRRRSRNRSDDRYRSRDRYSSRDRSRSRDRHRSKDRRRDERRDRDKEDSSRRTVVPSNQPASNGLSDEQKEKIRKRKEKLAAWKAKQAGVKQEIKPEVAESSKEDVKKEEEVDPLDAYIQEQEKKSRKAIQEALEKEKKEAEIVASGGHIEETKGEFLEDELIKMASANKRCYVCKKYGHTKTDCPDKRCLFCFQPGHMQRDCEKYTAHLEKLAAEEKQRKRENFYAEKKNRRREERLQKLRVATGVYGFQKLYEILGIPGNKLASQTDIKKAFQRQSLLWHPDKHATKSEEEKAKAAEKYAEIRDAYELLLEGLERGNLEGRAVGKAGDLADADFTTKWFIQQNMQK